MPHEHLLWVTRRFLQCDVRRCFSATRPSSLRRQCGLRQAPRRKQLDNLQASRSPWANGVECHEPPCECLKWLFEDAARDLEDDKAAHVGPQLTGVDTEELRRCHLIGCVSGLSLDGVLALAGLCCCRGGATGFCLLLLGFQCVFSD